VSQEFLWLRHWDSSGTQRKGNVHRWKPLPNDWWRDSRPSRISACSSELSYAWIGDSAIVNCNNKLGISSKSGYQSKPHVYIVTQPDTWQYVIRRSEYECRAGPVLQTSLRPFADKGRHHKPNNYLLGLIDPVQQIHSYMSSVWQLCDRQWGPVSPSCSPPVNRITFNAFRRCLSDFLTAGSSRKVCTRYWSEQVYRAWQQANWEQMMGRTFLPNVVLITIKRQVVWISTTCATGCTHP
jgi:hypothetical protein